MTTGEFTEQFYDSRKTYLKTISYDRLLDVLRQLAQFGFPVRPIVLRFILRHVTRSSYNIITFVLR